MSIILILWGIYFAFWGFGNFVDIGILPAANLLAWESGLYGAIMMGWGSPCFSWAGSPSSAMISSFCEFCIGGSFYGC